jgi:anti-sigma B factor antagonist
MVGSTRSGITDVFRGIVADLGGVDYISSAGLRVFLGVIKEARLKGGDLRLAAVQPDVQHVLDISGFTSFIQFFGDVDSALAGF